MAGQRIDIMDLQQLIQLKKKGMSNRQIGRALGLSRNTVNSYFKTFSTQQLSLQELEGQSSGELSALFPAADYKDKGRYEQLSSYFPHFQKELTKPGCTLQHLWYQYLEKHPEGYRYTQFTHYYSLWSKPIKASGILLHKAAEKLFVDFAGKKLSYVDKETGEVLQAEVFVAVLPCSHYTFVWAVKSQQRDDFILCLNETLSWFGGVPKAIVSDNLRSAVSKGHRYAPLINKTLKDFALHYSCVIDPARPYHPQDKALVEGAVKLVYQRIYYPLSQHTFFSLQQLNAAITELLKSYNDYLLQTGNISRRQRFVETEKAYLDPLPLGAYQIRYYKKAKVQKISHIYLSEDKNYYSVPHRYIGQQVEVQYNAERVEIFSEHQRICSHPRSFKGGHYSTQKDHMPSSHRAYSDWSPEYFEEKARQIGSFTCQYISRLIGQYSYPEVGYKQSQGILALARYYPKERLERACQRALEHHGSNYYTIEKILKNKLDEQPEPEPVHLIPEHENIRGAASYQ
jgi:transposase